MSEETLTTPSAQDVAPELDARGQKLYGLVDEMVQLFKPRIESGELSPFEVAEAVSVMLSGTIVSVVPPSHLKRVQIEAEALSNYLLKQFDAKARKKNYMFIAQVLGAAKFATYVAGEGVSAITKYEQAGLEKAEQAVAEATPEAE